MRLYHALRARVRSLLYPRLRDEDLHAELEFHLAREAERLEALGVSPGTARHTAARALGATGAIQEACRDARGRRWLDTLLQDVRYACRAFRRAPLSSATVVATVALGLGLVTAVFTVFNGLVFRADEVRNPHELFAVERRDLPDGPPAGFDYATFESLQRDAEVFSSAFAMTREIDTFIQGTRMEGPFVTRGFFDVLGVTAALGRTLNDDDERLGRKVIVLGHRAWVTYFAADPAVLGRSVLVNGTACQVVGIMPEGFRGLALAAPDFWAPLTLLAEVTDARSRVAPAADLTVVGRLRPGVTPGSATDRLAAWAARAGAAASAEPLHQYWSLERRNGSLPRPAAVLLMFLPLFVAFGLILVLGCANVANMLLARGVARQREIGIRLATGASRRRIVRQLVTESLLLALASGVLALGISRLVLTSLAYTLTQTFQSGFGRLRIEVPPEDWRVLVFTLAAAGVATLCFALLPARQATRVDLVAVMRGELVREARPGRARSTLIAMQVAVSMLLLTCAAVFLRGASAAAHVDPGIRIEDVVAVWVKDEGWRDRILAALASEDAVSKVAASWPDTLGGRPVVATGSRASLPVNYQLASSEYFDVLGIDLVRGRGFDQTERHADAGVVVVSEATATQLWPADDALGSVLRLAPITPANGTPRDPLPFATRAFVVVGIAKNVEGFHLLDTQATGADVYLPGHTAMASATLILRVAGDPEHVRRTLTDRLAAIDPTIAEVTTLATLARMQAYLLAIPFGLTLVLGALALGLTLSGLLSVLSYLVERRRREIGVRMALGATRMDVVRQTLSQLAVPVGAGLLVGAACVAAVGAALLAAPAADVISGVVNLLDPVAYAIGVVCTTAGCLTAGIAPALRASRTNPVVALRLE